MAIVEEFYRTRSDGVNLYRTYSDDNYKIMQEQTGDIYEEAIDVYDSPFTYVETSKKIDVEDLNMPKESQNL